MQKRVLVTGPESSGSRLVARIAGHVLGVCTFQEWNGHGWARRTITPRKHRILHRTMPWNNNEEVRLNDTDPTHVVLLARDRNASYLSRIQDDTKYCTSKQEKWIEKLKSLMRTLREKEIPYFVFSYEALLLYREEYLQELYNFLEVESDFVPDDLHDGNQKYYDYEGWLW